jgi:hypothetical protein
MAVFGGGHVRGIQLSEKAGRFRLPLFLAALYFLLVTDTIEFSHRAGFLKEAVRTVRNGVLE